MTNNDPAIQDALRQLRNLDNKTHEEIQHKAELIMNSLGHKNKIAKEVAERFANTSKNPAKSNLPINNKDSKVREEELDESNLPIVTFLEPAE